jgi:hypothetical protein
VLSSGQSRGWNLLERTIPVLFGNMPTYIPG